MTKDELVAWALELSGAEWRQAATMVSWFHRRRKKLTDLPDALQEAEDIITVPAHWDEVRREVRRRRQVRYRESLALRTEQNRVERREYMRAYMARRRRKARP